MGVAGEARGAESMDGGHDEAIGVGRVLATTAWVEVGDDGAGCERSDAGGGDGAAKVEAVLRLRVVRDGLLLGFSEAFRDGREDDLRALACEGALQGAEPTDRSCALSMERASSRTSRRLRRPRASSALRATWRAVRAARSLAAWLGTAFGTDGPWVVVRTSASRRPRNESAYPDVGETLSRIGGAPIATVTTDVYSGRTRCDRVERGALQEPTWRGFLRSQLQRRGILSSKRHFSRPDGGADRRPLSELDAGDMRQLAARRSNGF